MNPLKILIVDDEKAHCELMMRAIKKEFPGSLMNCCETGEMALSCLEQDNPHFMIVDYMLPGMNGLELLGKLQEKKNFVPAVIMVTGQGDERVAVEAMKLGAFDYLVKTREFFSLIPSVIVKAIERRKIESQLHDARQRFKAIYDYGGIGVSITDQNGLILEINQRLCEMLGYQEKELKSKHITDITHDEDILNGLTMKKKMWSAEIKTYNREKRYIRKDGQEIWIALTVVAVYNNSGEIKYVMGLAQDITRRKKDEETIRQLYHRIISAQEAEREKRSPTNCMMIWGKT